MDSRGDAGAKCARLPEVSRRSVVAGASAATVVWRTLPVATVMPDERTRQLRRWLALTAHIERLQDRWARLEGWLVREHDWLGLSSAEQQASPWARELRDIDGCLDVLFEQRDRLLASLPASGVVSMDSAIMRWAVVERLIWPVDHPESHALIAGVRRDLIAMSARGGAV